MWRTLSNGEPMKKQNIILPIFVMMLLCISFVQAGTLNGGVSVLQADQYSSNYAGLQFTGPVLVGSWSTTTAAADYITIQGGNLPSQYKLTSDIKMSVPKPILKQVFQVSGQIPIYKANYVEKSFSYASLTKDGAQQSCKSALDTYLKTLSADGKTQLLPGTEYFGDVSLWGCNVAFVTASEQVGWFGQASSQRIDYSQDIMLGGVGTLKLSSSGTNVQANDVIPQVGRVVFTGFSSGTSQLLTSNGINGFQPGSVFNVNAWNLYQDGVGISNYQKDLTSIDTIARADNVVCGLLSCSMDAGTKADLKLRIATLNQEADRIRGVANTFPAAWDGKTTGAFERGANYVGVPISDNSLYANFQFVLVGNKFGLVMPTGEPKIVSLDSQVTFDETASGYVNYVVKNSGGNDGAFVLQATCTGVDVVGDAQQFTLGAGEQTSGKFRFTGKSGKLTAQQVGTCKVEFKEMTTKAIDSRNVAVTLLVKSLCSEGQQTDPILVNGVYSVNILDAHCQIKETKTCAADGKHQFAKVSGIWTCQTTTGSAGGGVAPPEKSNFSMPIFITTMIVALLATGLVAFYGSPIRNIPKAGNWIYAIILVAVFIGMFFLVPYLWRQFVAMFSFPSLW